MKKLFFYFLTFILLSSCNNATKSSDKAAKQSANAISLNKVQGIDIETAKKMLEQGFQFIDLRTPKEIKNGKIPGAIEINFKSKTFKDELNTLDKEVNYVMYCQSGGRSGRAVKIFQELEFKNVNEMSDGFSKWK